MSDDDKGIKLFKRASSLKSYREARLDPYWQEISQYFWPDVSDINTEKTESTTGWFDNIFESTPIRASATCSVGVRNWLTPSTDPWLGLAPPPSLRNRSGAQMNPRLSRLMQTQQPEEDDGSDDASKYLNEVAEELTQDLASSNFYSVIQPFNRSACTFGTALMFCEEGKADLFHFEQFKVGTFVISENDEKIVDTVVRWFKLTVRQAAQKFGAENLPSKMKEQFDKGKFDEKYTFLHHVFPNEDFKKDGLGKEGFAFASVYQSEFEKKIVQESGFEEMPYFCVRWSRWGTDDQAYGCSPAFETLMEARQINFVTQYNDALVELKAFPRMFVPDNLDGQVQMAAGGVTVVGADDMVRGAKPQEWLSLGDTNSIKELVDDKRKALQEAFFVDIFKMFDQLEGKQQRTAFEIAQRLGEKLDKFTGTFDQYVTELINPLVRRLLGIAMRSGRLGTPPQSLMVQNDPKQPPQLAVPKIVVNSRVTLAIKALRNSGVQNTLATLQPLAEGRPEILDNFDLDKIARDTGRNFGMNEKDFRAMKYVIELRKQRAQQMQAQQAMATAEQAATAAGKLGKAPQKIQDAVTQAA